MARTVWGAHKRYMDTYLNVYKGYYVGTIDGGTVGITNGNPSSLEMGPAATMTGFTGYVVVLTM